MERDYHLHLAVLPPWRWATRDEGDLETLCKGAGHQALLGSWPCTNYHCSLGEDVYLSHNQATESSLLIYIYVYSELSGCSKKQVLDH